MLHLLSYQQAARAAILAGMRQGHRRQALVLPTGTGKTICFASLIAEARGNTLTLVHRDELVKQTHDKFTLCGMDPATVGIVKAAQNDVTARHVIASVQTLERPARLAALLTGPARSLIVCDEVHHCLPPGKAATEGNTWYQLLNNLTEAWPAAFVLGATATPYRPNNSPIIGPEPLPLQHCAYSMGLAEAVSQGYIVGVASQAITLANLDLDAVRRQHGDWSDAALGKALEGAGALPVILKAWQQHAANRPTIAFFPVVDLAYKFTALCAEASIQAATIEGNTPIPERQDAYRRMTDGTLQLLSSVSCLSEGFDLPIVSCAILARPTSSRVLYMQAIGRILRLHPTKTEALVLDCVGASGRHNLMSLAAIAGLADIAEESEDEEEDTRAAASNSMQPGRGAVTTKITIGRQEVTALHRRSPMRWVTTQQGRHVLDFADGLIRLAPCNASRELWQVEWCARGTPPKVLASHVPLEYAQGAAEDTARDREKKLIAKNAAWLASEPTAAQVAFARKLLLDPQQYPTRGQLSEAITSITGDW